MNSSDPCLIPAAEMARRIAGGELTSVAAVEAHIERIKRLNPVLNALVTPRFELARREAQQADARRGWGKSLGPLDGVPVTIKDSLDVQGLPSTFGLRSRAQHRAEDDEIHVARLRAAGAVVLGKTNVSQCLIYTEADNPLFGRTNNPWSLERSPGGSSGGEGALIAAGGSPLGLGTDIGGSVRVPANFCGLASLKPTSGRMDDMGALSVPVGQRAIPSQVGVLARHAADVALGFRVAATPRLEENSPLPLPGDPATVRVQELRVGYYVNDGSFATAPAVQRAVKMAADALRAVGAQVHEWTPPAVPEALGLFGRIVTADGGAGLKKALRGEQRTPQVAQLLLGAGLPTALLPALRGLLRMLGQHGLAQNLESFGPRAAADYWALIEQQLDYRARFGRALNEARHGPFDLVLAPACSLPAFTHGATRDLLTAGAYAALYNLLGYPAGVAPITRVRADEESIRVPGGDLVQKLARKVETGSAGLPVGVQVIAKPWQEHVALAAMIALEQIMSTNSNYPKTPIEP